MTDAERKQRICKNCDHFRSKQGDYGQCCRYAPNPQAVPEGKRFTDFETEWTWLGVVAENWCGEWKAKQL